MTVKRRGPKRLPGKFVVISCLGARCGTYPYTPEPGSREDAQQKARNKRAMLWNRSRIRASCKRYVSHVQAPDKEMVS